MRITDTYISVTMIRNHLDDIPHYALPPGYTIRWYHDGDEALWLAVQQASERHLEITHDVFMEWHGDYLSILNERMFFLLDADQQAIGTATAWFLDDYRGTRCGRVGWVAIVPQMRGKGLSRPMMTILCNRLRDVGHTNAYLTTSTMRFPAIRLYWDFGFRGECTKPKDIEVWKQLEQEIMNDYRMPFETQ